MEELKNEFAAGFRDGWAIFWSPFVGLASALGAHWRRRAAHRP